MDMQSPQRFSIAPKSLVLVGLAVIAFIAVWEIRTLFLVIAIGVVVAAFMNGPVTGLMRLKLPRVIATIVVYLILISFFVLIFYLFIPVFMNEVQSFIKLLPKDSQLTSVINLITDPDTLKVISNPENTRQTANFTKELQNLLSGTDGVIASSSRIVSGVVNAVLVMVIAFYFSVEEQGIDRFLRLITPREKESYVVDLWQRVRRKIELWFRGQVVLACVLGILTYIALMVLGVPYALLLSLLAVTLSIIPFGIVLATVPAVIIAFLAGGFPLALIVLGIYIVLQQIENHVFQPLFVKRTTGLPPVVVVISLAAGVALAGVAGLLIAVPVAVLLLELLSDYEKRRRPVLQSE